MKEKRGGEIESLVDWEEVVRRVKRRETKDLVIKGGKKNGSRGNGEPQGRETSL